MFKKYYTFIITLLFITHYEETRAGKDEMDRDEDIAIIGSGSGAFAAAIHAVKKGACVTMIESGTVGGTCVNVGCVPSKIFIRAGHLAHLQKHHPFEGLALHEPVIDSARILAQQQARVAELRQKKYTDILAATPEIHFIQGSASFLDPTTLLVQKEGEEDRQVRARKILVATGSHPYIPEIPGLSTSPYWTSTDALQSGEIPPRLIVLGGAVVALELAQAFSHFGSKVTLLARSTLLSREDRSVGEELQAILEGEGLRILTHTTPVSTTYDGSKFTLELGEGKSPIEGERLLVATGRGATTAGLSLEVAGIEMDAAGRIMIDPYLRTSSPHIYAVGDCTTLPQFVYVAAAAGTRAAENMLGGHVALDLSILPKVVFTTPQVGTIGLTEEEVRERGIDYEARTLPMSAVPRALANFDDSGMVKLIAAKGTRQILGAHIIAENAGDMIQTVAIAMKGRMTTRDLSATLFPYLTAVEGLKLAAQIFSTDVSKLSCCADAGEFEEESHSVVSSSRHTTMSDASGFHHDCCSTDIENTAVTVKRSLSRSSKSPEDEI